MLQVARKRLKERIAFIREPEIYPIAVQAIVDDLDPARADSDKGIKDAQVRAYWQNEFYALEVKLIDKLKQERLIGVAENILGVLERLFGLLNMSVEQQWHIHNEHKREIEANVIRDFDSYMDEQRLAVEDQLGDNVAAGKKKMRETVQAQRYKLLTNMEVALNSVTSKDQLDNFVKMSSQKLITDADGELRRDSDIAINDMIEQVAKVELRFDQQFQAQYKKVEGLSVLRDSRRKKSSSDVGDHIVSDKALLDSVTSRHLAEKQAEDARGTWMTLGGASAILLAMLGILGPLGWIIGGALIVGRLLGPSVAVRKSKMWSEMRPKIEEAYDKLESELVESVHKIGSDLHKSIAQKLDRSEYTTNRGCKTPATRKTQSTNS